MVSFPGQDVNTAPPPKQTVGSSPPGNSIVLSVPHHAFRNRTTGEKGENLERSQNSKNNILLNGKVDRFYTAERANGKDKGNIPEGGH